MTHTATHPLTIRQRAAWATVRALAGAAAWVISARYDISTHNLTDHECQAQGVPHGSAAPSIFVLPLVGARWWHLDAWTCSGDGKPGDGCLHLRALGMEAEVFFSRKRQGSPAAA